MKEYSCDECGKIFKQKCHWVNHTQNKKYPCVKISSDINSNDSNNNIIVDNIINEEVGKKESKL